MQNKKIEFAVTLAKSMENMNEELKKNLNFRDYIKLYISKNTAEELIVLVDIMRKNKQKIKNKEIQKIKKISDLIQENA